MSNNNGSVLHSLCQEGNAGKVKDYFNRLHPEANVEAILNRREGVFGYTPLHLAAVNGHFAVLQLLLSKGGKANAAANNGTTPLHLAATHGRVECVNVLIEYNADPLTIGPGGKTAKEMTALKTIVRSLRSAELVDAAEHEDGGVEKVLDNNDGGEIHPACLNRALVAAVEKKNYRNAHHLLLKGASGFAIDQVLAIVDKGGVEYVHLILVKAAISNDCEMLAEVCKPLQEAPNPYLEWIEQKKVTLDVPLKIARQRGNMAVWEKLMLMLRSEGSIRWSEFQLSELDENLLSRIRDVKYLFLDKNRLKFLPQAMVNLRQLKRLDLQGNELSTIPNCLLCLPSMNILNLSNNKLTTLPELSEWSSSLTELNISQNKLSDIPGNPKAPKLRNLYLSGNEFTSVPNCICNFFALFTLDISDNRGIQVLPEEMGSLEKLNVLEIKGLKLKEPPAQYLKTAQDCIRYLKNKLYKAKPFYSMKLMLVGNGNRGKTTLVARLQGKACGNEATVGVDISEWECSEGQKTFHFSIWDFAGQEEYYATHQCFLSDCSIYLVLFNVTNGQSVLSEIEPWLSNIALRAKDSFVHVVGTHLDEVPKDQRSNIDGLLENVRQRAELYIRNVEVHAVGLANELENVDKLIKSIYRSASEYKINGKVIMGQEVPQSYHKLYTYFKKEVAADVRKGTRQPIMLVDEYLSEVEMFCDSLDEKELASVTKFLINTGALLHYEDRSNNLHELYFIDPSWLCDMMSSIVAVKHRNPYVKDGILLIESIPQILHDERFKSKYFAQYLTLLDRFEIAFAIDTRSILIPSMLPERRPENIDILETAGELAHSRYIVFNGSTTPHGLWSRLVSRIMHSVSQIKYILDKEVSNTSTTEAITSFLGGIPQRPPTAECLYIDISQVRLEFWKNGVYYKDRDVTFLAESLKKSNQNHMNKEGVLISTSSTRLGRLLYGQLIDMAVVLCDNLFSDRIQCSQLIPCSACMQQTPGTPPTIINVEQCRSLVARGQDTITCERGHRLALTDIIPDQLLCDLDPRFMLNSSEICYGTELLGKGGQGSVYSGTYRGLPVAIKKYSNESLPDSSQFCQLRKEVLLFQKLYHPCLLNLIGVCVHPTMDVVLERAPLGSLQECLIAKQEPVHRIVIHRIAAQVAAALRAIHNLGIIYRDLKAANVLVWSLDLESLCHCKLTDFGTAIEQSPIGSRDRVEGTRGFTAPEVLGKEGSISIYNHLSDVFSFAMLLYQMIARRDPFHDCKDGLGRNAAVIKGERPRLQDVPHAEGMYFYLTRLMQACWKEEPNQRLTTSEIVKKACLSSVQSVMGVLPVRNGLGLRPSCVVPQVELTRAGMVCESGELWVCSTEKSDGTEIDIYPFATMKSRIHFAIQSTVQCIAVCGDLVWVSLRSGIEHGMIRTFNICTGLLTREIAMKLDIVCCITSSDRFVYCGTLGGSCVQFPREAKLLESNYSPVTTEISEGCIDGIAVTCDVLWVSHTRYIHLLDLESLKVLDHMTKARQKKVDKLETFIRQSPRNTPRRSGSAAKGEKQDSRAHSHIGSMRVSADGSTIWSCQLQHSSTISAWSVSNRFHLFDIDIETLLTSITQNPNMQLRVTAMTPVLDTVWVGTSTGHILILDKEAVLMWFQPYCWYIRFLECVVCEPERAIVVSGAKGFVLSEENRLGGKEDSAEPGTIVVWEGYPSKVCRQIQLVQEESSTFFNSHDTVRRLICKGSFKDGTNLLNPMYDSSSSLMDKQ